MKRFILALLLGFVPGSEDCRAAPQESRPVVGLILPLSGKAALGGQAAKNGAELANIDSGNTLDLRFEDGELDNTKTISALRGLIAREKLSAIVTYASGPSIVAAPIAENARIPMIGHIMRNGARACPVPTRLGVPHGIC